MAEHSNTLVTVKSNSSLQTETESPEEVTDEDRNEKACCPTLICESTTQAIPPNLQSIIKSLNCNGGSDTNKTDLIITVFYVLMIETGFIPKQFKETLHFETINFHKQRLLSITNLPLQWKSIQTNSYKLEFILEPFPDRICKMVCLIINQNITINIMINQIIKFCTQISVNKYVPIEDATITPHKFRYLDELSIIFKNQVALVAKSAILKNECFLHANLQDLPMEIMYEIFTNLQVLDFVHLKRTCKWMKECAAFYENKLWKYYYKRDYPFKMIYSEIVKWDDKYREEVRKKRLSRICALKRNRNQLLHIDII